MSHDRYTLRQAGSRHAPLWAATCLGCGTTFGWHLLISAAMRDTDDHRRIRRQIEREALDARDPNIRQFIKADYYRLRDDGQTTYAAAMAVGAKHMTAMAWDSQRAADVA